MLQVDQSVKFGTASGRVGNHPELEQITRFREWCIFGTLTFIGKAAPSQRKRYHMAFAFLRWVADLGKQDFSRLFWVLRDEQGETTGRAHFHVLLGRTRLPSSVSLNFRLMAGWEKLGGGIARASTYNRSLAGAEYVTKCLSGESTLEASSYELDKFGWTERPPILSNSLQDYLKRGTVVGSRSGRTPQVKTSEGDGCLAITGDRITGKCDGRGPRGPGTGKPSEGLIEQSSLLWRLGRHAYGPNRNGHLG